MFHKLFFECEEAVVVCDKTQYNEASFLEKIKLKIHIRVCKICKKHSERNTKLSNYLNSFKSRTLSNTEKNKLKNKIEHHLNKMQ